jgi:voltage-gated potassium channel
VEHLQVRLHALLEPGDRPTGAGGALGGCVMALIAMNVVAVMLQTVQTFAARYGALLRGFEVLSVSVFTVEYLLRLWTCTVRGDFRGPVTGRLRFMVTPLAAVDLLAILPFYLPMLLPFDLRFMRVLRLLRMLRVLKLGRYSESLRIIARVMRSKKEDLLVTAFATLILLVMASSFMYEAENSAQPEAFPSIPSTMWWAVVTLTTVGYGDVCPMTPMGKVLGSVIALLGIGLFALPAGILASGFSEELQGMRAAPAVCPHCGRLVSSPLDQ